MKALAAWLLLISVACGQGTGTPTPIANLGPDGIWTYRNLGMIANSRTNAAMTANESAFAVLWNDNPKARRGTLALGPMGYWIDSPIVVPKLCGLKMVGAGGIELYESENHFGSNAFGGHGSRLCAGATGMASLLNVTTYGMRIQDVTFLGNWRQAANDSFVLATPPTTLIHVRSNPGGNTLGTGKMVLDNVAFVRGNNGITFGDGVTDNNADNIHATRIDGQYMSGAIMKWASEQAVVNTIEQLHCYNCAEAAYFVRGGHANFGMIEVVGYAPSGAGTKVLHLGDIHENENHYKLHARLDNTCNVAGLKVVKMDNEAYGTVIECHTAIGYDFRATPRTDIFDIQGATQLVLAGGPYYESCIKCTSSGSYANHVVFVGATFTTTCTPDECVNTGNDTGDWTVKWYGCCDVNGQPIADGEATD